MTDSEQWNADMDAWGLDDLQRCRYLWRLHDYHQRLLDEAVWRMEVADRIPIWFAAATAASVIVSVILWLGGGS